MKPVDLNRKLKGSRDLGWALGCALGFPLFCLREVYEGIRDWIIIEKRERKCSRDER